MNQSNTFRLFIIAAIALLVVIFFSPIWWVSLKAPNYPPEAFPDGIRIHFHINAVFNGCKQVENKEIYEAEALDCVHEMNTINHYIGMYPLASGGPIERALGNFLFAFLGVLLLAFMMKERKSQAGALAISFIAITIWAYVALFTEGGISLMSEGYQQSLLSSMELEKEEIQQWSGIQAIQKSYSDAISFYFGETDVERKLDILITAIYTVIGFLGMAMIIFIVGILLKNRFFYWLLLIIPLLLPVFFMMELTGWLWWFGHSLNEMGAFSVKPFMPTVFGNGKVAQFTTYSYPHYGFALMVLFSLLLAIAGLLRRKQLKTGG